MVENGFKRDYEKELHNTEKDLSLTKFFYQNSWEENKELRQIVKDLLPWAEGCSSGDRKRMAAIIKAKTILKEE